MSTKTPPDWVTSLDQFCNPANPELHRRTTAVEIWNDTAGNVEAFVSAVGTGGTITGVGEVLKAHKPDVRIVAVEPALAAVLSGGHAGHHKMPGIGVGFGPPVLNTAILDEVIAVADDAGFELTRAALAVAERPEMAGRTVVVLLADSAERYITTELFRSGSS